MLNILFIADVIGSPGRDVVKALLPELKRRHHIGLTICNGENAAGGFGLTRDSASELLHAGVDVLTGGNHLWDRRESIGYLGEEPKLVRPANLPEGTPGQGWRVFRAADGTAVGVVNLLGRVFMKEAECPFRTMSRVVDQLRPQCKVVFVDFHAETTAEKIALGWHLDGKVSALVGTHTHVQTADDHVLPSGTAFLCDAGMTGGFDSVIGMDRHAALRRFLTLMPERLTPSGHDLRLNGAVITVDPVSGKATTIRRLQITHTPGSAPGSAPAGGARLLRGDAPAETVRYAARTAAHELKASGIEPCLALVSVGDDPASAIYLKHKSQACAEVGITVKRVALAGGTETGVVIDAVRKLGDDPDVHGILVQLPVAPPAESQAILEAIPPDKDVDGFHPENAGRLSLGLPGFVPATPLGIVELLRFHEVALGGGHAVVLGRSNVVGRPLANLLSSKRVDMTVTVGHSASGARLIELAREADLLVAAMGRPEAVTADWVKPGAVVVDVGIHRIPAPDRRLGSRIVGDVEFGSVSKVAGALTPVPGGVGPMTVAMLLANTIEAVRRQAARVRA